MAESSAEKGIKRIAGYSLKQAQYLDINVTDDELWSALYYVYISQYNILFKI